MGPASSSPVVDLEPRRRAGNALKVADPVTAVHGVDTQRIAVAHTA
mgnify:FL=1